MKKDKKVGLYLAVGIMVLAWIGGIIFALNHTPRNENRNLKLVFDYAGFTKTKYVGSVTFKKNFEDVSLKIVYRPDVRFYSRAPGAITCDVRLTDEDGNPVSSVTAGVAYRFYAHAVTENKPDMEITVAGQQIQDKSSSDLFFYSGERVLYRVHNR